MSRIDEMIYHLDAMAKQLSHAMNSNYQEVDGKQRACCVICGHCPEAEAEWLRAIKQELQANTKAKSKLAQTSKGEKL